MRAQESSTGECYEMTAAPSQLPEKKDRKPRTSNVPKDESKNARFIRLAEQRVTKAVKAIQIIANLNGPSYDSTAEQRTAIIKELANAVVRVENALSSEAGKSVDYRFKL